MAYSPGMGGSYGGGTVDFYSFVQSWEQMGVFDVILPFLLVFVFTFAILEKVNIFQGKKNLNVIISAIIGLLFLRNGFLIYVAQNFLGNVAFVIIILLVLLMLFGIFGHGTDWTQGAWKWFGIGLPILAIWWSLFRDLNGHSWELLGWWYDLPYEVKSSLIPLLIFIVVIAIAVKGGGSSSGSSPVPPGGSHP